MSLKEKTKNEIKKKFKKIVFKIIKPFIPFIIVIFLIVLAVCTVVDSMFTTEDDMKMAEKKPSVTGFSAIESFASNEILGMLTKFYS